MRSSDQYTLPSRLACWSLLIELGHLLHSLVGCLEKLSFVHHRLDLRLPSHLLPSVWYDCRLHRALPTHLRRIHPSADPVRSNAARLPLVVLCQPFPTLLRTLAPQLRVRIDAVRAVANVEPAHASPSTHHSQRQHQLQHLPFFNIREPTSPDVHKPFVSPSTLPPRYARGMNHSHASATSYLQPMLRDLTLLHQPVVYISYSVAVCNWISPFAQSQHNHVGSFRAWSVVTGSSS